MLGTEPRASTLGRHSPTISIPGPIALSPDLLPRCALLTGLAEKVHCDLQPVDTTRGEVTFTTSRVSEGCVAQVVNAAYEVHVLFLDFPKVSPPGRAGADGTSGRTHREWPSGSRNVSIARSSWRVKPLTR